MVCDIDKWTISNGKINKIKATVPGDVTFDLYREGVIADPLFAMNLKEDGWIFNDDWTYESVFDCPSELFQKERIELVFEGIDTVAEISLNNKVIGNTDNMFLEYRFSVKDCIKKNNNVLTVKVVSSVNYAKKKDNGKYYLTLFNDQRVFMRKAQCHFGWDWAATLPGIGLWLPVYLTADDGVSIKSVYVNTDLTGKVCCQTELSIQGDKLTDDYNVRFCIDGKECISKADSATVTQNTKINQPKLWWTNNLGEQNLYDYSVELIIDGAVVDKKCGKTAFREIKIVEEPLSNGGHTFGLKLNGVKIFAKGSNWVPISNMTGSIPEEAYDKLLLAAKGANYNILRVWGGGIYEKDRFYELCDKYGILVWQDFCFACSAIPADIEGLEENFLNEANYQLRRIRNHPSLAVLCGGNEYASHRKDGSEFIEGNALIKKKLKALCENLVIGCSYIHNSPYGKDEDEWANNSGDCHIGCFDRLVEEKDVLSFRKYASENSVPFISENTVLGCTRLRSLKKFLPKSELEKTGDSWEYHFLRNQYGPNPNETFLMKEKRLANTLFGDISSMEDFVKKSMITQAEIMTAEMDCARSNPICAGYLNWMYNDNWGCGTWSVIDYYFEKKASYYAQKRAFSNVYVCAVERNGDLTINLINDSATKLNGYIEYGYKTIDGASDEVFKENIIIDASSKCTVRCKAKPFGDYLYIKFISNGKVFAKSLFFYSLWKDKTFKTDIETEIKAVSQNHCQLKILAKEYARTVFIDSPDNEFIDYSDNFFDLEKGESAVIDITSSKKISPNDFCVKTYADKWTD